MEGTETQEVQTATFLRVSLDVEFHEGLTADELRQMSGSIVEAVKEGQIEIPTSIKSVRWTKMTTTDPNFKWDK